MPTEATFIECRSQSPPAMLPYWCQLGEVPGPGLAVFMYWLTRVHSTPLT